MSKNKYKIYYRSLPLMIFLEVVESKVLRAPSCYLRGLRVINNFCFTKDHEEVTKEHEGIMKEICPLNTHSVSGINHSFTRRTDKPYDRHWSQFGE